MLSAAQQWLGDSGIEALRILTDWGGPLGWLFALQLSCYLLGLRAGLKLIVLALLTLLLNTWLKWLWVAPRPYLLDESLLVHRPTGGFGMPSGHAQGAAVVWWGLAVETRPRVWLGLAFVLLGLAVAVSRWLLGVHSLAQIVVGLLLGLGMLLLAQRLQTPLSLWIGRLSPSRWLVIALAAVLVPCGVTELLLVLRADYQVPELWVANAVARGADAEQFSHEVLFARSAPLATAAALLGVLAVAALDGQQPLRASTGGERLLATALGVVVTALFWLFARVSGWAQGPLALAIPLIYPLTCCYLPLWWVAKRRLREVTA